MDDETRVIAGLISNWHLARKGARECQNNAIFFETIYELSAAIMHSFYEHIISSLKGEGLRVKMISRGMFNHTFSFKVLDFSVEMRVFDTLELDDGSDSDEVDEHEFVLAGLQEFEKEAEEGSVCRIRRIFIHIRHPLRMFFWGHAECVSDQECSNEIDIMEMDCGEHAAKNLYVICDNIMRQAT